MDALAAISFALTHMWDGSKENVSPMSREVRLLASVSDDRHEQFSRILQDMRDHHETPRIRGLYQAIAITKARNCMEIAMRNFDPPAGFVQDLVVAAAPDMLARALDCFPQLPIGSDGITHAMGVGDEATVRVLLLRLLHNPGRSSLAHRVIDDAIRFEQPEYVAMALLEIGLRPTATTARKAARIYSPRFANALRLARRTAARSGPVASDPVLSESMRKALAMDEPSDVDEEDGQPIL